MVFRSVFGRWRHVNRQHDAGEFWQHLICAASPSVMGGTWEARLDNPPTVVEQAPLFAPVVLQPAENDR